MLLCRIKTNQSFLSVLRTQPLSFLETPLAQQILPTYLSLLRTNTVELPVVCRPEGNGGVLGTCISVTAVKLEYRQQSLEGDKHCRQTIYLNPGQPIELIQNGPTNSTQVAIFFRGHQTAPSFTTTNQTTTCHTARITGFFEGRNVCVTASACREGMAASLG